MTIDRRTGLILGGGVLGVLLVGWLVLPHIPFFRVRQVELLGVRYLAPGRVLADAGLAPDQNLFDDLDRLEARVRTIPGVVNARAERRFPGTLRLIVTERIPVALAPGPDGLVALDLHARPLPYEPSETVLDLPVVARPDSVLTAALAMVSAADPELFGRLEDARRADGGGVAFAIGGRRLVLGEDPSVDDVHRVGAVWRHLEEKRTAYTEMDGRFQGMVVVRGSRA